MARTQTLEANLANVMIAELAGDTLPQVRHTAPYERVELGVEEIPAELRRTRRRAATISREDLALRVKARAIEVAVHDDDAAHTLRFSAPYERIEIDAARPSLVALTSGSFEAAWFVSVDDVVHEQPTEVEPASTYWIWIVASAATFAVGLIAGLAIT